MSESSTSFAPKLKTSVQEDVKSIEPRESKRSGRSRRKDRRYVQVDKNIMQGQVMQNMHIIGGAITSACAASIYLIIGNIIPATDV